LLSGHALLLERLDLILGKLLRLIVIIDISIVFI
jgi:hypothetical protein